ncbi:MAG: hypothetical protein WA208_20720 [Thermoanaerobaculia bacterium]
MKDPLVPFLRSHVARLRSAADATDTLIAVCENEMLSNDEAAVLDAALGDLIETLQDLRQAIRDAKPLRRNESESN